MTVFCLILIVFRFWLLFFRGVFLNPIILRIMYRPIPTHLYDFFVIRLFMCVVSIQPEAYGTGHTSGRDRLGGRVQSKGSSDRRRTIYFAECKGGGRGGGATIGGDFWWLRCLWIPRFSAWTSCQYIGNAVLEAIWRPKGPCKPGNRSPCLGQAGGALRVHNWHWGGFLVSWTRLDGRFLRFIMLCIYSECGTRSDPAARSPRADSVRRCLQRTECDHWGGFLVSWTRVDGRFLRFIMLSIYQECGTRSDPAARRPRAGSVEGTLQGYMWLQHCVELGGPYLTNLRPIPIMCPFLSIYIVNIECWTSLVRSEIVF